MSASNTTPSTHPKANKSEARFETEGSTSSLHGASSSRGASTSRGASSSARLPPPPLSECNPGPGSAAAPSPPSASNGAPGSGPSPPTASIDWSDAIQDNEATEILLLKTFERCLKDISASSVMSNEDMNTYDEFLKSLRKVEEDERKRDNLHRQHLRVFGSSLKTELMTHHGNISKAARMYFGFDDHTKPQSGELKGMEQPIRKVLETIHAQRVCFQVQDDPHNPGVLIALRRCETCNLSFAERHHIASTWSPFLDKNDVWLNLQERNILISMINENFIGRHQDCRCLSLKEINQASSLFNKRKTSCKNDDFPGFGSLHTWINRERKQIRSNCLKFCNPFTPEEKQEGLADAQDAKVANDLAEQASTGMDNGMEVDSHERPKRSVASRKQYEESSDSGDSEDEAKSLRPRSKKKARKSSSTAEKDSGNDSSSDSDTEDDKTARIRTAFMHLLDKLDAEDATKLRSATLTHLSEMLEKELKMKLDELQDYQTQIHEWYDEWCDQYDLEWSTIKNALHTLLRGLETDEEGGIKLTFKQIRRLLEEALEEDEFELDAWQSEISKESKRWNLAELDKLKLNSSVQPLSALAQGAHTLASPKRNSFSHSSSSTGHIDHDDDADTSDEENASLHVEEEVEEENEHEMQSELDVLTKLIQKAHEEGNRKIQVLDVRQGLHDHFTSYQTSLTDYEIQYIMDQIITDADKSVIAKTVREVMSAQKIQPDEKASDMSTFEIVVSLIKIPLSKALLIIENEVRPLCLAHLAQIQVTAERALKEKQKLAKHDSKGKDTDKHYSQNANEVDDQGESGAPKKAAGKHFENVFPPNLMHRIQGTVAEAIFRLQKSSKIARSCCNHKALHSWIKKTKKKKNLLLRTSEVREFYIGTLAGRSLLKKAGFMDGDRILAFEIDHIFPQSSRVTGVGMNHVANYYLMSPKENRFFSDHPDLLEVKLNCIGELARFAAMNLQKHIATSLNEETHVDLVGFRLAATPENYGLKQTDVLSPHVFISKNMQDKPAVIAKPEIVENAMYYVSKSQKCNQATFRCDRKSDFINTQVVDDESTPLNIHVYPMRSVLFEEDGKFTEGAIGFWVTLFAHCFLQVKKETGLGLFAGAFIKNGSAVSEYGPDTVSLLEKQLYECLHGHHWSKGRGDNFAWELAQHWSAHIKVEAEDDHGGGRWLQKHVWNGMPGAPCHGKIQKGQFPFRQMLSTHRLGSFINASDLKNEGNDPLKTVANVEVRIISYGRADGSKDRYGNEYGVRAIYYATRDIQKGEEILHFYKYKDGAGKWHFDNGKYRNIRDLLDSAKKRWLETKDQLPCKCQHCTA